MSQLSTEFINKSDPICVIECLLSWNAANKPSCDLDVIENILSETMSILSEQYISNLLREIRAVHII